MADVIPITRQALHQAVVVRLRQRIVEGLLAPGAKLNERELAEALAVSRTPLREALRMLAAEGLVELLPNRGAAVVQLGPREVADTFEVVAGLEGLSGELAAARITDAELDAVRALHVRMLAAHRRRDLPGYYRLNAQIHAAINDAAHNPVLTALYTQVNARLQALRFRSNLDRRKWDAAVDEHGAMLARLAVRDGPGLRAVLAQHLARKRDTVLELMARGDAAGSLSPALPQPLRQAPARLSPSLSPSPAPAPAPAPTRPRPRSQPLSKARA